MISEKEGERENAYQQPLPTLVSLQVAIRVLILTVCDCDTSLAIRNLACQTTPKLA